MNDFYTQYKEKINEIDAYMKEKLRSFGDCEKEVFDAMEYAVFNGGKRIRSVLCTETARMLTGSNEKALPFAAAIEFIHAFSLVHDDLPCMDDDDMRRGMPSCHKKFGEDLALLAGDALLNTAYEVMAEACENGGKGEIKAMRHIAASAGVHGMINGQVRDIKLSSCKSADESKLLALIEQKTMALIMTGVVSAAYVSNADFEVVSSLERFAYNLGIAFQIRDDFEDEEQDNAAERVSPNFINTLGKEAARARMNSCVKEAYNVLEKYENNEFIKGLLDYLFDGNR